MTPCTVQAIGGKPARRGARTANSLPYHIILSFAAYLKIAPNTLQIMVRTQKADMADYVARMKAYAEIEENEKCREMIEDNIAEVDWLGASSAITRRFFPGVSV